MVKLSTENTEVYRNLPRIYLNRIGINIDLNKVGFEASAFLKVVSSIYSCSSMSASASTSAAGAATSDPKKKRKKDPREAMEAIFDHQLEKNVWIKNDKPKFMQSGDIVCTYCKVALSNLTSLLQAKSKLIWKRHRVLSTLH